MTPDTVTDALAQLHEEGYTADFELTDGRLCTSGEGALCTAADAVVERLFRFEGPSDPGDEMIVFGLRDPGSGVRGTLASAYGPAADPELREHLAGMRRRFE
jgi:hypothetical protein